MFSSTSGKAAGRRGGKRARSQKKKSASAGSDDLHDFIHDIEFSAKKILKQHMQKRLTEATIEQREKRRRATGLSSPSSSASSSLGASQSLGSLHGKTGMSGTGMSMSSTGGFSTFSASQTGMAMPSPDLPGSGYGGPQTDGPGAFGSTAHTLGSNTMGTTMGGVPMQTLPSIGSRSMSASVLSGTGVSAGNSGVSQMSSFAPVSGSGGGSMMHQTADGAGASLPRLSASSGSPTRRSRGRLTAKDRAKLKASPFARTRRTIDEEEAIDARANVKTDKSVGMTGGKMLKEAAKLAGATIKGDVHALSMLRADHAVDRKMSAQAWADPNAKTGIEKGMSTLGLVLDRAHELQGPTGWSSDDLRRKYRDETERLAAYEAGLSAKKEAERLEREQNVIRPFVLIPMHPLHMYYVQMCGAENEKSRRRARSRNQLKSFSLDLITIWHANRPEGEGMEEEGAAGQIARVRGLVGRRPGHAIKAFNAQVQSVSIGRAMQGSMSSKELHLMGAFGDQKSGGGAGGSSLEGIVTLAEKDAADAEATRQRRMMWQRPWYRSVAQVPILDDAPQTVEELLDMLWKRDEARLRHKMPSEWRVPGAGAQKEGGGERREAEKEMKTNTDASAEAAPLEFAPARVSIFRRGRGEARRLVYHVHDVEETTASSMQIDETDADELLREMARGVLTRQRQDEEVAFGAFRAHVETEIAAEEASWAARVARREAAAAALLARRQAHMSDASKSEFVTAAEFGCCIQGKYVLMTIEAAVSALAGCVPSAACVRLNAYDPLDCSTTSVEVLGVDLLKMLAVDVKGDNRYPGVPPIHGSPEEKSQWESHQEMFTMYVDEDSEDLRVRACHWVHGDQGIPNSDSASRAQSLRCTYEDVSDYGTLPLTERMRLAKLARAFWCDYYGRLPIWQSVVHRLAWQREVDQNTGKTVVGSVSLKFECPASIGAPRFERETAMHEQKMRNLTNKLRSQESLMIDKREHMEEHLREAAEKILTPEFKQQALMRLVALMPAPEFDEDDVDNPAAQWADQLVATLVGGDNYIGEGQSSVRGRDEAEEWAAAQEAAREEARLKLANDTLSYVVCGEQARFGQVPGVSIAGYMDVVTLDFRRDAERSSTNSVLVTICTALENALLCPMLGGYDTIVEVADSAPEEPVGGPITTLVPPSSCRQATTALNKRLPHTCIIFNDSEAPLDHFIESNYTGHRRNEPPRHEERGFARYSLQRLLVPDPVVPPNSFGVTERAAVANSAGCWPRRHTWHSEEVANGNLSRVRRQSDYAYVSERKFASGSNDPNIYVAHMDTYKVGQLEMRKLSWFLRDERTRIERAKKEEEDAAMQARIEAGKQMAAQREADRLEMERQSHYAELRAKKRRRGKGKGQGSEADDWKARRNRSEMVGVCDTAGGDLWFAFLDKTVGAKDGGGTIFYHSDKLEERNGVGSSWDRPVDWEGVVGGPDMMKKVHDYLVATGQRAPDADAPALSKEEQEAHLSEQRLAKIEAEKKRRVDEAIREKQEHYVAVVSRVRRFIDERARLPGDRYDLRRPFDNFDADGQGSIDKEEFTQVLELLFVGEEIDFWPDEVDRLMAVFDDTQDGFITFGKFVRFAMGENPNVDTGLPEPENLIANGDDALGIRIRKLLEKIYEWTEDFDPATDRKYWYNPASASSVYEEPESLGAAVKALEAEKALIDSQRREKTANEKQRKAEAKAEKHMKQLPKTMGEFVQKLAGNSEFVDMLAKQLGLEKKVDPEVKRKQKEKDAQNKSKGKRAALDRERRRLEGMGVEFGDTDSTYSGEGGDGEEKDPDASSDSDLSDDDEDGAIAAEKRRQALLRPRDDTLSRQAELERRKLAWRRMKPANVKKNFVTAATSCKVAKAPASLCKANTPSVCGIVDPAEAIVHVQPPQLIPPRVDFVEDVMASSDRLRALADGGEDAMAASEKKVAEADLMEENTAKMFSFVRNADFEGVDTMLDEGVDVSVRDVNGNTPLLIAAQQGLKKISKLLLRRGAKINAVSLSGNSVLHYCFTYSFESLGEYFISKGADDSLVNAAGLTCYEGLDAEAVNAI